jgi:ubiquinone biosynthesis protein
MPQLRLLTLARSGAGLLWGDTAADAAQVPERLRKTLETLGTTFVKLGQTLSLRRDLLPPGYVTALQMLQDHVPPFPTAEARAEIARALGRPVEQLFAEFDDVPLAAASIAQVHRARLPDGRAVIVKVRRPGIRSDIDRDMRALLRLARLAVAVVPWLRPHDPVGLAREIWDNLRKETDFREEARNMRRFAEAFRGSDAVFVPEVIDPLYGEAVLVQETSSGVKIGPAVVAAQGPRLARLLVDAYLRQFFVVGLFHGDPHPGNLFVLDDGRLCFHDLGLVGYLDRASRRALAMFVDAFAHQEAAWLLDAAIDLGILGGVLDRSLFRRGIEEILADYAALPLKDWSIADAVMRVARLGQGRNFAIPHNMLVLMRAIFIVESTLRTLDPEFRVLDALLAQGEEQITRLLTDASGAAGLSRLRAETALTAQDLPLLLAGWLHRTQREGMGPLISLDHRGLDQLRADLAHVGERLVLALIALGLFVAGSLLVPSTGASRQLLDLPWLTLLAYGVGTWLTIIVVRGARGGRRG